MGNNLKAAVDIGSNSVRLLIGEIESCSGGKQIKVVCQQLFTTRLGQTKVGLGLNPQAVDKTLAAMAEFKKVLASYNIASPPIVAATSAVREAADSKAFADKIQQQLGWQLLILPGQEEARLSYLGAASVVGGQPVVIDVGGGSTEVICQTTHGLQGKSVKVGAVRLYKKEVQSNQLAEVLTPLLEQLPKDRQFVAVGGTITTLGALKLNLEHYSREAVNGICLSRKEVQKLYQQLAALTPAERLEKYPMLKNREDIILAGTEIYLALMELAAIQGLVISDAGLLDGLLLDNNILEA